MRMTAAPPHIPIRAYWSLSSVIWLGLSVAGVFVVMSGVAVAVGAPVSIVLGREVAVAVGAPVVESVVLGIGNSTVELGLRAELLSIMVVMVTITASLVPMVVSFSIVSFPMADPPLPLPVIPLFASQHAQYSIIALASKSELRTDINTNY